EQKGGAADAASTTSDHLNFLPPTSQIRTHSCRIQRPFRFFNKTTPPSAVPSLVKPPSKESSERLGCSTVTPIRLHVPLLRKTLDSPKSGIAAMALAVSCEATAMH